MGPNLFRDSDTSEPYAAQPLRSLMAGVYTNSDAQSAQINGWIDALKLDGSSSDEYKATRALDGILKSAYSNSVPGEDTYFGSGETKYQVGEFGLLREAASLIAQGRPLGQIGTLVSTPGLHATVDDTGDNVGAPNIDPPFYALGPYRTAAVLASRAFNGVYDQIKPLELGPKYHNWESAPNVTISALVQTFMDNLKTYGFDYDSDEIDTIIGLHSKLSIILGSGVLNEAGHEFYVVPPGGLTFDWDTFTWSDKAWIDVTGPGAVSHDSVDVPGAISLDYAEPDGAWPPAIAAPTVGATTPVEVEDHITEAVDAYTTKVNLRHTQDVARLRRSFFSTRQMMSTAFDGAMAILTAQKEAEITDYEKSLRVRQAELQAQADLAYQSQEHARLVLQAQLAMDATKSVSDQTLQREAHRTRVAELKLQGDTTHARLALDANISQGQLSLEASKATEANKGSVMDVNARGKMTVLQVNQQGKAASDSARLAADDTSLRAEALANEGVQVKLRMRADMLRLIYETTLGYMRAKSEIQTNAAPLASIINTAEDLRVKGFLASREHEMQYKRDAVATATQYASAMEGIANLKWNAFTQNLELYRAAINTMSGVPGGTSTHKPSAFQIAQQIASGVLGAASMGINLGMIFS